MELACGLMPEMLANRNSLDLPRYTTGSDFPQSTSVLVESMTLVVVLITKRLETTMSAINMAHNPK